MMESLKYFLLKFWPNILDDIWHDCKAVSRAFKDTRDVYKRQMVLNKKFMKPYKLDRYPDSQPPWNFGVEQRYKVLRFGHDPLKQVFSRRYPDGTNVYKASLLNLKELNEIFSSARYQHTPLLVIFVWAARNIIFKRHFKGWFRSYLFKNVQRIKEYSYAYLYSFGSWWPISSLKWLFIRIIFRALTNLLFLGPVFKFISGLYKLVPKMPRLPTFSFYGRRRFYPKKVRVLLKGVVVFTLSLIPTFVFKPFDILLRFLIAFDIIGVILFSLFRHVFSVLSLPFTLLGLFLLNRFVRVVRRFFFLRASLFLPFLRKRFLYFFHYFAYILYFKCMLIRHLASIRIRIRLRRKKPNPIRRFSNWVTYTRYKLTRYQTEKLFYAIGQALLVLPVRFSKTSLYAFLSRRLFQIIFWRGFPFNRPYLSNFLTERSAHKFFSYFSIYDDLTLTNFFSNETAFPTLRLIFYEYDDWSASFEEFDEFEDHLLDMSQSIRSRRLFIVKFVAQALSILKAVPSFLWRLPLGQLAWRIASLPYMVFDLLLGLFSFLLSLLKAILYTPVYGVFYLIARARTSNLVLAINLHRADRYGLYNTICFVLVSLFSLVFFLEFFYIFGTRILLVQEFLMRNLDSYMYNYLFIWLFPMFVLSLVSQPFAEIWRESKYYLITYPIVVHGWLLFYLIRWSSKKKFGLVGNFADYLNKDSFWFNDALHPVLGYFYLNWQPFLKYKKFTGARPYHGDEFDLKRATFDFVTSLF